MAAFKNLNGKKFNKLVVIAQAEKSLGGRSQWLCKCDCGNEAIVQTSHLTGGHTNSCGCYKTQRIKESNTIHGQSISESKYAYEYNSWTSIRNRCYNINEPAYPNYGGRGIIVCDRWLGENGFENFLIDMGPRPTPKHSLDRFPNNDTGIYEKENCRWATPKQQNGNRRDNRWIEHNGIKLITADWAIFLKTKPQILYQMLKTKPFEGIFNYYTYKNYLKWQLQYQIF